MPLAKTTKTIKKTSSAKTKEKKRPTLDDVVEQLLSLQGFGTSQDCRLLQLCGGNETEHKANQLLQSDISIDNPTMTPVIAPITGPIIGPIIGPLIGPLIGVDEAGRGCLAGPVVAAAVILPTAPSTYTVENLGTNPKHIRSLFTSQLAMTAHLESLGLGGLADSKKLTEAQRDALAPRIRQHAVAWGLGVVWPQTIDRINILQATFLAMARAVYNIRMQASLMLIDGNKAIPSTAFEASHAFRRKPIQTTAATINNAITRQLPVVGGDDIIPAISAASILAKTYRDKVMVTFDKHYPVYGFAKHKGYGTKDHLAALAEHGPCTQHRLTFRGVVLPNSENDVQSSTSQNATLTSLRLC